MAVAVLGGGWMGWAQWREQATYEQAFATQRGQQRTVRLPDTYAQGPGSTLQLDTATRLQARLYRDRREVRLADGQALFSVQPDRERPFEVWAGALRITVVGTRFSVRHTASGLDAGQTVIAVEEGLVRVARADPGAGTVELTAGQRVVASGAGHISPVASVPASAIAAWRNGRISFDQTPLAQAIAEFERYGPTGLVVRDPAVAELPVGGSYSVHQWQRFAAALPLVLPVRLEPHGDRTDIVAL
jgi:transmembrane sensor